MVWLTKLSQTPYSRPYSSWTATMSKSASVIEVQKNHNKNTYIEDGMVD